MKSNMLNRLALAVLIFVGTTACQDTTAPSDVQKPTTLAPALSAAEAARVGIAIEDAIVRLVPAGQAGASALRQDLHDLAAMLATADAATLDRQVARTRETLDAQSMPAADADFVRLALAAVANAARSDVVLGL